MKDRFFDIDALLAFLAAAVTEFEKSAPTVARYADGLFMRLEAGEPAQVREIQVVARLREGGQWMHPNYAANTIYHLMADLGMDTTGHPGF